MKYRPRGFRYARGPLFPHVMLDQTRLRQFLTAKSIPLVAYCLLAQVNLDALKLNLDDVDRDCGLAEGQTVCKSRLCAGLGLSDARLLRFRVALVMLHSLPDWRTANRIDRIFVGWLRKRLALCRRDYHFVSNEGDT